MTATASSDEVDLRHNGNVNRSTKGMAASEMHLVKACVEYQAKSQVRLLRKGIRGLYVLYREGSSCNAERISYDVMYVGMTTSGVRGRLEAHARSAKKEGLWTHFSVFEVWDNIQDDEIKELEGLFRHVFQRDSNANSLNVQRAYQPLVRVRKATVSKLMAGR